MTKRELTVGDHRLEIDGEWGLLELSGFGRQYVQVYSMLYALQCGAEGEDEEEPDDRTLRAFGAFPWTGGWSAVDFYDSLRIAVPHNQRPQILAMEYASPGYIELGVILGVAVNIRRIVDHLCSIIERANDTYSSLYRAAMERKLLKVDARRAQLRLERDELEFAEDAARRLAATMDLDLMDELERLTENPLVRMKILFSLYRRVRDLARIQASGRIRF